MTTDKKTTMLFLETGLNYSCFISDEKTLICPSPHPTPASGSSSFSVFGFMTAAVVASTVAANLVNNVNNNNNNNNNNDNNDNQEFMHNKT